MAFTGNCRGVTGEHWEMGQRSRLRGLLEPLLFLRRTSSPPPRQPERVCLHSRQIHGYHSCTLTCANLVHRMCSPMAGCLTPTNLFIHP
ncbi:hypothetical protein E4U43_000659 [Claviceps pusilla]|uniref:Uncharacterized protein n=1 Tax=Claviceps pusilla TaxID=123648 RepID=A0A9P7NB65_9HYPO|nr:hypothetical protein E4U43_000659 [Claviceps pusilla]